MLVCKDNPTRPVVEDLTDERLKDYVDVTGELKYIDGSEGRRFITHKGHPICELTCDGSYLLLIEPTDQGAVWKILRRRTWAQ